MLNLHEEGTLLVAVRHDRRNGRLGDLLLIGILTLTLIDYGIVLGTELLVGPGHHLLLRDLREAIHATYDIGPLLAIDKGIDKHIGTTLVRVHHLHHLRFEVVDRGLQERLVPLAATQQLHLAEHQLTHLVE